MIVNNGYANHKKETTKVRDVGYIDSGERVVTSS